MGETQAAPRADLDAEAAVLSAALLEVDAALELIELITPGDFYADANRRVFSAIHAVLADGGTPDVVSVASRLRADGRLEQIGGTPYLAQLADATPAVSHVAEHARIVKNLARIRRAGSTFALLAAEATSAPIDDADAWLERCEQRALGATGERGTGEPTASSYRELAAKAYETIAEASKQGKPRIGRSTGFRKLDDHIGGLEAGDLIILAGRPGMGKTALALQIAEHIASDVSDPGMGIVLSLEMTRDRLMLRSLGRVSGERMRELRIGKPGNWSRVCDATANLSKLPIIVDDDGELTPLKLRAKVRRHLQTLRAACPTMPLGMIVVDYVQLMDADFTRRGGTRTEELTQITRALKRTAKDFGCTVLALSQFRRPAPGKTAARPELADLRDSGSIEQDADVVLAIHRDDAYRPPHEKKDGLAELLVLKGRNSGEAVHIVRFDGARTAFFDDQEGEPMLPFASATSNGGHTNGHANEHADDYDQRYP